MSPTAQRYLQIALGVLGVLAAGWMLGHTDFTAVRAFGALTLLVVALEGLRVLLEAQATRALLGCTSVRSAPLEGSVTIPWRPLLRVHLIAYAFAMVMPAGRTVAEASKAVLLRTWVGGARGVGVGATNQALVLLAGGLFAGVCAGAAQWRGHSSLALGVSAQALALLVSGGVLLASLRSPRLARWIATRLPRVAKWVQGANDGARVAGVPTALWCFIGHRAVQALQLALLLAALGRCEPLVVLAFTGATIVGTSVGVAVPGQLGAVGGALALAAPGLGFTAAEGLALALMLHVAQLSWAALGFATWALTRAPSSEDSPKP